MKTILVVDDEATIRLMLQRALTAQGYNILLACDGVDALAVASAHPNEIDLLLTDVQMPEMGGLELARAFAQSHPGTKVIFITGAPGKFVDQLADKMVVAKPFAWATLMLVIRASLEPGPDPEKIS